MLKITEQTLPACWRQEPQPGWPLYGTAATRQLEQAWRQRLPAHSLMQRAGAAIARLALALAPHARQIWIACGPGNNGGDGLQAAAWLARHGAGLGRGKGGGAPPACRVLVSCTSAREHMPEDAQAAWQEAEEAGVQWVEGAPRDLGAEDLCIDALLGIGLRAYPGAQAHHEHGAAKESGRHRSGARLRQLLTVVQGSTCPVLCVDIASGLDGDTGQYAEGLEPQAPRNRQPGSPRHCLALLTLQPGHFTGQGRDACGQLWWDDLGTGLAEGGADARALAVPVAWLGMAGEARHGLRRPHASHKGSFGDVVVLGGQGLAQQGQSMAGAAWLAALAALHAGAGRTMLALLDTASQGIAPWPEIMLRHPSTQAWDQATVVCGCGGGQAVAAWLPQVLAQAPRLVLDADGLNAVAADKELAHELEGRARIGLHSVLTPHPLEAARLLQITTGQVQADRLAAARQLARRFRCTVLLKGSGTVVASAAVAAQSACVINPTGNARLATGGTGDVLAGLIGALWAQGLDAAQAATQAAYRHGQLADEWPDHLPFSASALALRL